MYLYLFTITVLYYFLQHHLEGKKIRIPGAGFNFFNGFVTAVIYCFIGFMIEYSYRLPEYSFKKNFIHVFCTGSIYPFLCCFLIYVLFGKNRWSFKLTMLTDVYAGFMAVFLPFRIYTIYLNPDYFFLFILPSIWICCLFIMRKGMLMAAYAKINIWLRILAGISVTLIALFLPAVSEVLYMMKYSVWLRCFVGVIPVLLAAGSFLVYVKIKEYDIGKLTDGEKIVPVPVVVEAVEEEPVVTSEPAAVKKDAPAEKEKGSAPAEKKSEQPKKSKNKKKK